jgi:hypothetical protein
VLVSKNDAFLSSILRRPGGGRVLRSCLSECRAIINRIFCESLPLFSAFAPRFGTCGSASLCHEPLHEFRIAAHLGIAQSGLAR